MIIVVIIITIIIINTIVIIIRVDPNYTPHLLDFHVIFLFTTFF